MSPPDDLPALLAWLEGVTVPDGLVVAPHLIITDGQLWQRYYRDALRTARGQVLRGAVSNVAKVKEALEGRQ